MAPVFRFSPISFSWIAIHPEPKGVIQFIGGAFFGTFPTVFYSFFLQKLFDQGYTIIALPFRFSFRHWSIAIDLLKEQEIIRKELLKTTNQNLDHNKFNLYKDKSKYFWIGHSLGCKYIALLSGTHWKQSIKSCIHNSDQIHSVISNIDLENASILNQPSLLIAPDISDTESAIPVEAIARFIDKIGLGALPTRKQTQCLIEGSGLFNLTRLISFNKDTIAGNQSDICKSQERQEKSDVLWFMKQLDKRGEGRYLELEGKHLEPLGVKIGDYIVDLNPWDKFVKSLKYRFLEDVITEFLSELNK
jgi:hypothetical protein